MPAPRDSPDGSAGIPHKESVKMNALKNFIAREDGQDLVEYALLAALLSIVSIAALKTLGPKIALTWNTIENAL
jgi:pilus assembly protein Flp/PilA